MSFTLITRNESGLNHNREILQVLGTVFVFIHFQTFLAYLLTLDE
jgi:hypothetical protein